MANVAEIGTSSPEVVDEEKNAVPPQPEPQESKWRPYLILLGSFFGLTTVYGFTNSVGAVQSYLNLHQLRAESSTRVGLIFSLFSLLAYIWRLVGGVLYDAFGAVPPLVFGTVLMFFGMFFTGSCHTVGSFMGVLGVMLGIGSASCSAPLNAVVNTWWFDRKQHSTAFGLATLGGSVGGIVFPLILNRLYIVAGFTWALRTLSFICLVLMGIAIAMCGKKRPGKEHRRKLSVHQIPSVLRDMVDLRALVTEPKYILCIGGLGMADLSLMISFTYFSAYVTQLGFSETKANSCLTIMNCLGIPGRYFPGLLADKIGPFNVIIMMDIFCCLSIWLLWTAWSTTAGDLASCYVFSVVYGFFNGAILSVFPSCMASISPVEIYGRRYGTAYLVAGFILFGGMLGAGALIGNRTNQEYKYLSIFCGALYFGSALSYSASRYFQKGWKLRVKV